MTTSTPYSISDCSVRDSYRGESFASKTLTIDGIFFAGIDFSIVHNEIRITSIVTRQNAHRRGYASALVNDLFREFPDYTIRLTNTTPDGTAFFQAAFDVSPARVIARKHRTTCISDRLPGVETPRSPQDRDSC